MIHRDDWREASFLLPLFRSMATYIYTQQHSIPQTHRLRDRKWRSYWRPTPASPPLRGAEGSSSPAIPNPTPSSTATAAPSSFAVSAPLSRLPSMGSTLTRLLLRDSPPMVSGSPPLMSPALCGSGGAMVTASWRTSFVFSLAVLMISSGLLTGSGSSRPGMGKGSHLSAPSCETLKSLFKPSWAHDLICFLLFFARL